MITSRRIIVYRAKKLMDNNICQVMVTNTVVVITMCLCFDVKVQFLTYKTTTAVTFKLKTNQSMRTYLG